MRDSIISMAGVQSTRSRDKYLGLPALVGRSRVRAFQNLKERIWSRVNGWKEKFLSYAGKEILLKAVIQAIPTYTMSVFQLLKAICQQISSMMGKFWWGSQEKETKIAWMSWSRFSNTKLKGGLGFRDLESFNKALLAKQGWRLLQNPNSLMACIFKENYYSKHTFSEAKIGYNPSYAWRSIMNAQNLLKE